MTDDGDGTSDGSSGRDGTGDDTETRDTTGHSVDSDVTPSVDSDGGVSSQVTRSETAASTPDATTWTRLVPDRVRTSFSARLLVALSLIVVVVAATGAVVQAELTTTLQRDVDERLLAQTRAEADELGEFVTARRTQVELVSDGAMLAPDAPTARGQVLERRLATLPPPATELHLVRVQDGTVVASTGDTLSPGESFAPFPRIGTTSFDGFDDSYVTDPYTDPQGRTVVAFVSPVRAAPTTLLVLTVRSAGIAENFASTTRDGFTQVVSDDGRVLFARDDEATLRPYQTVVPGTAPVVERGRDGESGIVAEGVKERSLSRDYVQAYSPVAGTDWVVVKHAPTAQAYGLATAVRRGVIALTAVTLVGVVLVGGYLGRDTAAAVTTLAEKAAAVESGAYDVELRRDRSDEIGDLVAAVGGMRDRLVTQIRAAETAREEARAAESQLQRRNRAVEEQKTMISVLNRFLRHNLRNRMNVVLGQVQLLSPDTPPADHERRRREIRETVERLLEQADKARHVESLASEETPLGPTRVDDLLAETAERVADTHDEAVVETDLAAPLVATGHDTLAVVFDNLLENAVIHNDRSRPTVTVSAHREADADGEWIVVTVADDGPGIPDHEVAALDADYETAVTHGSGLGLWISDWIVSELDGELAFEHREPTGTRATVRLPAARDEEG
ncbi:ATP-binding protein [Halobaculum sp. MBLA0147]|uniref:sensor histidine kinase n=1 Tax=Halobaculum sp. MBLA0147 TaxID=3079934 RepID=UPI00352467DC